jgi:hypothetical protein
VSRDTRSGWDHRWNCIASLGPYSVICAAVLLTAMTHAVTPFDHKKTANLVLAALLSDQKVLQEQQTLQ